MSIGAKPWEGAGGAATVPDASETTKGKIRIATSAEAATGTDDLTAMTPLTVKERIDAAISGGIEYKGTFDASTGLPSLANAEQGDLYKVSTAGTIYGKSWAVGDHLLINADMGGTVTPSKIDKVDNTESVTSVNGQTGATSLGIGDLNNVVISGGGAGGDLVEYDAVDGRWENVTKASINVGDFNDDATYQLRDAGLTSIAGLTTSADKMIYATASDTYAVTDLTAAGRALLDDADAAAQRTTLGLGTAATSDTGDFQPIDAGLTSISGLTTAADKMIYTTASDTYAVADLTSAGRALLDDADASAQRTTLGLGTAATSDTGDFLASTAGLDDLSDVAYTAGAGIDNYVLTYDHSTTSWGAEAVPSAASASETVAGVIEIATNAEAAAGTATDKALVPSNISSVDLSQADNTTSGFISGITGENLNDLSDVSFTAGAGIDNYVLTYDNSTTSWGAEAVPSASAASETVAGVIEIATNAEAAAGTATDKALVPSNISSVDLSQADNTTSGFISGITGESLNDLSDVSYTAGAGIDNYVLTYDHSTTSWGAEAATGGGISAVVDDTTPQLGGALDVNGNAITSASNGNVTINPDGTGDISVGADIIPDADATHTIGDETNRFISLYSDVNGAIRFKAKNDQGAAISKGQVVYIKGVSGTVPTVGLARANSSSTMPAFGLALDNANDQAEVQIITFGNLTDYDTTTYSLSANDTVFVSAATAGALTNSAPTGEANLIQNIGRVVRADASAGIIKVGGAGRSNATPNLDQDKIFLGNASNQAVSTALSAINLTSFNNDLASASETVSGLIEIATNAEAAAGTATDKALVPSNISSVDLSQADNTTSGFISGITGESLNDLSDVSYTAGAGIDNYVLTYDHSTTSWGAEAAPTEAAASETVAGVIEIATNAEATAGTATDKALVPSNISSIDLNQLGDVSYTAGAGIDNYVLTYDHSTTSWGAEAAAGGGGGGFTYSAVSTATTAQAQYHYSVTGTTTITLPAATGVTSGQEVRIKNMGSNTVTVSRSSTDTIDGETSISMAVQYQALSFVSNGSNGWEII